MTGQEFANYIRLKTRTDSNTFTDADIVTLANAVLEDMAMAVIEVDEEDLGQISFTDLKATPASNLNEREYPLPEDMLSRLVKVEVKLGNEGTEWIEAEEMDINVYNRPTDETTIQENFYNGVGGVFYYLYRNSIWLMSGEIETAITDGMKLFSLQWPQNITTSNLSESTSLSVDPSTTSFRIPRNFHKLWATGVIIEYKESREEPIPLTQREANYRIDMERAISSIRNKNKDRTIVANLPHTSKYEGNNGYNF